MRLPGGARRRSRSSSARCDEAGSRSRRSSCTTRRSTTSSTTRPGRRLEGAEDLKCREEVGAAVSVAVAQYAALSRRSSVEHDPSADIDRPVASRSPLLFLALNSSALGRSIELPGFPEVDSFLQFMIATTIIQGALFGSIAAGADMATDIEGGFFERLIASPVARTSILVGRLARFACSGSFRRCSSSGSRTLFGLTVEGGLSRRCWASRSSRPLPRPESARSRSHWHSRPGRPRPSRGASRSCSRSCSFRARFFPRNLMNGWFKTAASINPL